MTARPVRLLAGFLTVGAWTMASRVLGFLRDILIAALLGTGPVAEAFFVAFRLPNMFRRFFAEGAFNMAFVPLYAKRLEGEGAGPARAFAEQALSGLATVLIVFTLIAQAAMPWLVLGLASGFADGGERLDLATAFGRICFPYILFVSLAALFSGVLNAHGRFAAAAAAPVLLNLVLIAAMGLAWGYGFEVGQALAWAVFAGGVAQLLMLVQATRAAGIRLGIGRPCWTPEMARLVRLGLPAALAGGVLQINLLVGTQVASWFDGAVGWLWYADRVYQLPLGLVGVAIGVVLLPELSRRVRAGDAAGGREALNRASEVAMALTLPATVALLTIPVLVTRVLFERGAFAPADTEATALALMVYALGLPAFVQQKIVQPAYFAREDTVSPLRFAAVSMLVNAAVAIGLAPLIGWIAAALGTVLAAWVNLWLLWRGAARIGADLSPDARLTHRLARLALAALAMGAVVLGLAEALAGLGALPALAITVPAGALAYAGLAFATGAVQAQDLRAALARRPSP